MIIIHSMNSNGSGPRGTLSTRGRREFAGVFRSLPLEPIQERTDCLDGPVERFGARHWDSQVALAPLPSLTSFPGGTQRKPAFNGTPDFANAGRDTTTRR